MFGFVPVEVIEDPAMVIHLKYKQTLCKRRSPAPECATVRLLQKIWVLTHTNHHSRLTKTCPNFCPVCLLVKCYTRRAVHTETTRPPSYFSEFCSRCVGMYIHSLHVWSNRCYHHPSKNSPDDTPKPVYCTVRLGSTNNLGLDQISQPCGPPNGIKELWCHT